MKTKDRLEKMMLAGWTLLAFFVGAGAAAPLQGMYDYGDIGSPAMLEHLDEMGAAGFQLVVPYTSGSTEKGAAECEAYLDRAQQNGMQVVWDFNELVGLPDAAERAAATVELVKDHPATWGYYVGDENSPQDSASYLAMARAIQKADPGHPRIYVDSYSSDKLVPFAAGAEYLGLDVYPIGQSRDSAAMVAEVGEVARELKRFNGQKGKRTVMVLQAFDWADDKNAPAWKHKRSPTRQEMRQMRDEAQAADPDIVLWFSYYYARQSSAPHFWKDVAWAATGG